jgi:hypothetical protein
METVPSCFGCWVLVLELEVRCLLVPNSPSFLHLDLADQRLRHSEVTPQDAHSCCPCSPPDDLWLPDS